MRQILEADYLVVGSGAMGMAFTDTLMTESDARVVMIDRQHQPGGHWNVAYPFVRLHQPSAFYGVNSRVLGSGHVDETGWNQGLAELATSGEVCAYFDQVMQQQFLPSGRVQYFPLCEYEGGRAFRSRVGAGDYEVRCDKVVDSTYMNVSVPSMRPPPFEIKGGAHCAPLNALPRIGPDFERFVVVGAGKTGMDACLFLLKNGVDPERIRWIMPRDSWLLDRAQIQPGKAGEEVVTRLFAEQLDVIAESESPDELFQRLDTAGMLLRLDPEVTPTMYRCATVTKLELEQLRRIRGVIRQGRVTSLEPERIVLEQGEAPTDARTLHVDCTADGLATRPVVPVFDGDRITLQSLRVCQQVFSAAMIGHVECGGADEASKNEICTPLPHPDTDVDFLRTTLQNGANQARWSQDPELVAWLYASRLDGFTGDPEAPVDPEQLQRLMLTGGAAIAKLEKWLAEAAAQGQAATA